jgi:hypothetical protein
VMISSSVFEGASDACAASSIFTGLAMVGDCCYEDSRSSANCWIDDCQETSATAIDATASTTDRSYLLNIIIITTSK